MKSVADLRRRNGIAASAASGLPRELFDAAAIGYFQGFSQIYTSVDYRAEELEQCLSDNITYNKRRVAWLPLVLRSDKLTALDPCSPCEDFCGITGGFVHEIDSSIAGVVSIQNRITEHSADLAGDFELISSGERKFLRFFHNPFDDVEGTWSTVTTSEFGKSYREIHAWMYNVDLQENYVRRYLSPITEVSAVIPAEIQRTLLRLRAYPSIAWFRTLLGQISYSPVAMVAGEVEDIYVDTTKGSIVVVNGTAHRAAASVTPIVNIGDQILEGDLLFDGFNIAELGHQAIDWDTVLRLPGSLFGLASLPYLSLSLTDVPVEVAAGPKVTFDLGPHSDIYWDHIYSRSEELIAESLVLFGGRMTINPYDFFVEQRLRQGAVAVRLRGELIADYADVVKILHKCLPIGRTLILQIIGDVPASLLKSPPPCCVF